MDRKEEILNSKVVHVCDGNTKTAIERYGRYDLQIIYFAMEQYAKEQMEIAFRAGKIYCQNGSSYHFEEWYEQASKIQL